MDKAKLLAKRLPEDDVEVPGIGTFRVRGLSRYEVMLVRKLADGDEAVFERKMMAMCILAPYTMTEAEVEQWQRAAPADEMAPLSDRIGELSGLSEVSEKNAYKSVPDGSDA